MNRCGTILGPAGSRLSAKDPNRTGTGVTPLEPESSSISNYSGKVGNCEASKGRKEAPRDRVSGPGPNTCAALEPLENIVHSERETLVKRPVSWDGPDSPSGGWPGDVPTQIYCLPDDAAQAEAARRHDRRRAERPRQLLAIPSQAERDALVESWLRGEP